jgi:lipopolysaccharide export system protein LptA
MRTRKIRNNLLVSLLLILTFHVVSGFLPQPETKKKRIEILNSDLYTYDAKIIANADRLIGNVELMHNNVLLYCDSAYSYKDSNMVDAFGHVHIIQGDTLNLYGDRIKYEGNSKIARVKGNVKLVNKSIVLTTDELIFDLRANVGNYHTWGKIVDTANVLVSKIGRYYSNEDLFFFKDSVKVTNKDFVLTADTLKYNSKTERVFIVGPTHIVGTSKKGTLYSESGWYDTRTNIAELYKASKIIGKEQSLQGDTIFYSRNSGIGRARSRVLLSDTTNHIAITGRNGSYNEKTKIAFVTDSAVFMQFSPKDTLFLHADTLKSIPDLPVKGLIQKNTKQQAPPAKTVPTPRTVADSLKQKEDGTNKVPSIVKDSLAIAKDTTLLAALTQASKALSNLDSLTLPKDTSNLKGRLISDNLSNNPSGKDSIWNTPDTLKTGVNDKEKDDKIFMAYHRVRFYKKDLQGICDSLAYLMKDSVMRLFSDPVLWSEVHQLSAEKIEYRPHNPGPDIARLENNGFIISREDSIKYNQISGKTLLGFIYNNKLKRIEVNGNAVTLYYLKNKERFSGMNKLESSKINVYLVESKIDSIAFFPKPEGKTIPLKDLTPEEATLKGFTWRESEKPKNRFDIFSLDEKRKKIAGPEKKPASKK